MARLIDTIAYGNVIVAVSEDEYQCIRITFHRRDRRSGTWSVGIFDADDLPFLLMAIQRAYAKHRGPVDGPSTFGVCPARKMTRAGTQSWGRRARQVTLNEAAPMPPRRIP